MAKKKKTKEFDLEAEIKKLQKKKYTGGGGDTGFRAITVSFKPKPKKKGKK